MIRIICRCFIFFALTQTVAWADFEADLSDSGTLSNGLTLSRLRERASAGDADARLHMGNLYFEGREATRNYVEAAKWYLLAARQGNAQAQFNLGAMYDTGAGMAQNQTEAVRWYRAAAQQGLAIAQLNLGVDYSTGQGVLKNDAEAIKWFRLAANQGEPQAQFNLGLMYAKGQGVAQNFVEAYRWAKLAADQGHDVARSLAHDLSEKMAQDRTAKPVDATPVSQAKVSANTVTPEKIAIYVQIGAFKSEKLAEKFRVLLISKLGDVGKPLGLYTEDDLVRIQVGPYDSASDARAAARSLKIRIGIEPMLKTR